MDGRNRTVTSEVVMTQTVESISPDASGNLLSIVFDEADGGDVFVIPTHALRQLHYQPNVNDVEE